MLFTQVSPVLNCVQSNQNRPTMHAILSLRFLDQESLTNELLRLIFAGKIKNHFRIFEGHFSRIVKNYEFRSELWNYKYRRNSVNITDFSRSLILEKFPIIDIWQGPKWASDYISWVIRQIGKSQNGCFKKRSTPNFPKKVNISHPLIRTRTCAY